MSSRQSSWFVRVLLGLFVVLLGACGYSQEEWDALVKDQARVQSEIKAAEKRIHDLEQRVVSVRTQRQR